MTVEMNRVRELLVKMIHHRQRCEALIYAQSHRTLARSAYRFVKIEKVMIQKMAMLLFKQDGEQFITAHNTGYDVIEFDDYNEMHAMNKSMLKDIKSLIKTTGDTNLTALVSYWLAALQIENDEMHKHLPTSET